MSHPFPSLRELAASNNVTQRQLVEWLIAIYNLDRLDILLQSVKKQHTEGMKPVRRAQLKAFVVAVAEILDM